MPTDPSKLGEPRELALEVGRAVRRLREGRGLSQEKFAELTGHHRTYIGLLERGQRTPNIHTAMKIAMALDMTLSEFFKKAGL